MSRAFDVCGPLPTGRHRARGQRRAPARRTRSPRSRRATSPRACRWSSCCSSRSRGWPPASCATACASGWSRSSAGWRLAGDRGATRSCGCSRTARRRGRRAASRAGSRGALADFDAATIATTHGFCQEVLGGLGVAGDVERDVDVVEDVERPARARSSTTSTSAASTGGDAPRFTRARGAADRRAPRSRTRRAPIEPPTAPATDSARRCARGSPQRVREELERAQAARWRC